MFWLPPLSCYTCCNLHHHKHVDDPGDIPHARRLSFSSTSSNGCATVKKVPRRPSVDACLHCQTTQSACKHLQSSEHHGYWHKAAGIPGFFGEVKGRTEERPGGTHCRETLHFGGMAVFDPASRAQSP